MGLFTDIIVPASEVMFALERRGMPFDEARRAALVADTQARVDRLSALTSAAAHDFHQTRRAKVESGLGRIEDELAAFVAATPRCPIHAYRGLTQLGKRLCVECRSLWETATRARERAIALKKRIAKGRALLNRLGDEFDPGSPDHWRAWFFSVEGLGLKPIDTTPKQGKPSLNDDSIEALAKRHPDVEPLKWRVERAHLQHRLDGPLAVVADSDGCVRFAYSLHRTATGQTASGADDFEEDKPRASAGNAQNITDTLRQMFVARDGEVVLHVDYSQIEARINARLARCLRMLRAFQAADCGVGPDIHSLNAAAIYGCAPEKARTHHVRFGGAWVAARYAAKRATHGWDYGMGDYKTARIYGLTLNEARRARQAYFAAWPELLLYQDEVVARVERHRFLVNPFGRKLRFWGWIYRDGRWQTAEREEAIAFTVASTAKDIAKAVMPEIDREARALGALLRTHTHDSFTFWCPAPAAAAVRERLTPLLERPWPQLGELEGFGPFWCPVDWSEGRNWAEAHDHDEECEPGCDRLNPEGLRKVKNERPQSSAPVERAV